MDGPVSIPAFNVILKGLEHVHMHLHNTCTSGNTTFASNLQSDLDGYMCNLPCMCDYVSAMFRSGVIKSASGPANAILLWRLFNASISFRLE